MVFQRAFRGVTARGKDLRENYQVVLEFVTALCMNGEGLPFNDFFRFQANFMVTTDFMLLALRLLEVLLMRQGQVSVSLALMPQIKTLVFNLISFIQGPNLKNQTALA
jgi:hypothetical protein